MLASDLGEELRHIFDKLLVLKLDLILITANFVEVVHVELGYNKSTCLTKDDMFECLKYRGRTISSKALRLWILKEHVGGINLELLLLP